MSETLNNGATGKPGLGKSLLATKAGNTLRYSMMNIFILLGTASIAWVRALKERSFNRS